MHKICLKFSLIFIPLILMGSLRGNLYAQEKFVISGTITDGVTGEALIGATIFEVNEDGRIVSGTISDVNGNYILTVSSPMAIIKVSFIGYKILEIQVNGQSKLKIKLEAATEAIDEVRIVAEKFISTGLSSTSVKDMTSSAVKIDLKQISEIGVSSAEEAMQGLASGVDIVTSGNPGSGSNIVIRGMGSLGNSQPLFVIDGIPQDLDVRDMDLASSDVEDLSDLISVAPSDIKDITILKDAAATSQWGSKGADGVILIETRKGAKGPTTFDYQYKLSGFLKPPTLPMLNGDEYVMLQLEQLFAATGYYDLPPELAFDPNYINFHNYSQNTDWIGAISRNAFAHEHNFSVNGGGEKTRYYASVNYLTEDGTTLNTALNKISNRVNLDYSVSDKLSFGTNFSYTTSFKEDNYKLGSNNVRAMAYKKAPNMSIYEYDVDGNLTGEYFNPIENYQGAGSAYYNPVAMANLSNNDITENNIQISLRLNYRITKRLRYEGLVALTYLNKRYDRFLPYTAIGADWLDQNNNKAFQRDETNRKLITRNSLRYSNVFATHHKISFLGMWETEDVITNTGAFGVTRTSSLSLTDPATNASINNLWSSIYQGRSLGGLVTGSYKLFDRYIVNGSLRIDGSSKFGRQRRWGYFPSVSAAWQLGDELFLTDLAWLNILKLRASWGVSGKAPGNATARFAKYNTATPPQYINNDIIVPKSVQLENLKWQTVTQSNLAMDAAMFNNKLDITFEIYTKLTEDVQFPNYNIPTSSGFNQLAYLNGGKIENKGFDFNFLFYPVRNSTWTISLNMNGARNVNSYLEFPPNFVTEKSTSVDNEQYPRRAVAGQPIGSFYGFQYLGVYPTNDDAVARDAAGQVMTDFNGNPIRMTYKGSYEFVAGDPKYRDVNNDGDINILDAVYLGNSNPNFTGGFGGFVKYRDFSFSLQFFTRAGQSIVNQIAIETQGMRDKNNQSKATLHRWRKVGDGTDNEVLPRAYMNHPASVLGSDRFVEDGSFIKLNNLTVGYNMPREICRKLYLRKLRISGSIRKLYTWTSYSGLNPEIKLDTDPFWMGVDNANTPPPTQFTVTLNIKW